MNRDRMRDKYANVKPNFYVIIEDKIALLWARKNALNDTFIVSAFLSPLGPYSFRTHHPTDHKGTYLFRKQGKRIYSTDLIPFPDDYFDAETNKITFKKFLNRYPGLKWNFKSSKTT